MIETGACHDIILSDYLALSLAIPPPVKRPAERILLTHVLTVALKIRKQEKHKDCSNVVPASLEQMLINGAN
jgi:hypothetical protein